MTPLPSGTVTLLFTDIEGSTRLARELGDQYPKALAEHRRIVRAAVAAHHGTEVDTQGDAFLAAFGRASEAVAAAEEAQRALATQPLSVRMGLHTGEPVRTEDGYVGVDLSRGARICSAGHGGQVLLSEVTRKLLDHDVQLRDLGEHRLKDLVRPERLFQLLISGLVSDFPALRTMSGPPTNLPAELIPMVGREAELARIKQMLQADAVRLLTLTGPGGVGKTRLALVAGARILEDSPDGVFFVPLAAIHDPGLVVPSIMRALGLRESAGRTPAETLGGFLAPKQIALLLDNFEHLVEAGPEIADLLLNCPRLKVIATSREPLRLSGEYEYLVPPLGLPSRGHLPDAEALSRYESIVLFVARAQAVRPDFKLTTDNAVAVAEICRRVDGLPLAIELAAARVKVLSPKALLGRLDKTLPLLTGGPRDMPARQRTLEATLMWSYGLLSEREQTLFARLSLFVGGCTLEAAEAICEADLDGLRSLLDKSLIRREGDRYFMLETTREYGLSRLVASHELDRVQARRSAWYMEFAEQGERDIRGTGGAVAGRLFEVEHDNLRTTLRDLLDRGHADVCLKLAMALAPFWYEHGYLSEGLNWFDEILAKADSAATPIRARAFNRAGALAIRYGSLVQARSYLHESLRLSHDIGDASVVAAANSNLGTVALVTRDYVEAASRYEEANRFFFSTGGYDLDSAICLDHIATLELLQGRLERASDLCSEGIALARKVANDAQIACTLHTTAMTRLAQGKVPGAVASLAEALERAQAVGDVAKTVAVIEGFAAVSVMARQWERAACLFGFADAYRATSHISDPVTRALAQPYIDQLQSRSSSEAVAKSWREGRSLSLERALITVRLPAVIAQPASDALAVGRE